MLMKDILYFDSKGSVHTDETLKVAKERADELGIRDVVVASTLGNTGAKAVELFKGYNVVVIPHVTGYQGPGEQELIEENIEKIGKASGKIVIAAHSFSGVEMAVFNKWNTMYPAGIIAQTLRIFGEGMKVVVEIAAMAADAGAIPPDNDILAIAGSHRGADTAVIIKPANSHNLFDTVIREIIAKPRNF
jgi:hypothetical protein